MPSNREPHLREILGAILSDLRFPARRWQLVTAAELWGADQRTRNELAALPDGIYSGIDHVARHIAGARPTPLRRRVLESRA